MCLLWYVGIYYYYYYTCLPDKKNNIPTFCFLWTIIIIIYYTVLQLSYDTFSGVSNLWDLMNFTSKIMIDTHNHFDYLDNV